MVSTLKKIIQEPQQAYLKGLRRISPALFARRSGALARAQGIDGLYLILSFDCDTEEDYKVVWDVHSRLLSMGICPVYAVCGELLENGADIYAKIAGTGAEFMNHGGRRHTYFDNAANDFRPCFFYNQQSRDILKEDILHGDRSVTKVTGKKPMGFRAPHFGTFSSSADLSFVHETAKSLGYQYCSTTVPGYGLEFGPASTRHGVTEFPVSGRGSDPFTILDSWGLIVHGAGAGAYYEEGMRALEFYTMAGAGILNYYADPSHVHAQDDFFRTVAAWAKVAQPISYSEILKKVKRA